MRSEDCIVVVESGSIHKEYRVKPLPFDVANNLGNDMREIRKLFKKSKFFRDENMAMSYAESLESDYGSLFLKVNEDF
jgi:hypothetical protein